MSNDEKEEVDYAYIYCLNRGVNDPQYKTYAQKIIRSGNPYINLLVAMNISGADIKAHGEVVIASGESHYNCFFAKFKGADVAAHQKAVIESRNINGISEFAKYVPGADKELCAKAIESIERSESNKTIEQSIKFYKLDDHMARLKESKIKSKIKPEESKSKQSL